MTTIQFPPLCPFGNNDDSVEINSTCDSDSSRWLCWDIGNGNFLRVGIYENGERSYRIATRKQTQDDFLASYIHGHASIDAENLKRLRGLKMNRIVLALQGK